MKAILKRRFTLKNATVIDRRYNSTAAQRAAATLNPLGLQNLLKIEAAQAF
jgi:hypothetical protein